MNFTNAAVPVTDPIILPTNVPTPIPVPEVAATTRGIAKSGNGMINLHSNVKTLNLFPLQNVSTMDKLDQLWKIKISSRSPYAVK